MPNSLRALLAFAACAAAFLMPPILSILHGRGLWWAVAAAVVATGTLYAFYRPHEIRYERKAKGQCLRCGYDLRATPGRCPECGKEATTPA